MVLVVLAPSGLNHRLPTWGVRLICGKIPVGCGSIPHLVSLDLSGFIVSFLKLSLRYQFGCVIGFSLLSQNLPRVWSSAKKLCLEFENIVSENPPHLQLTE